MAITSEKTSVLLPGPTRKEKEISRESFPQNFCRSEEGSAIYARITFAFPCKQPHNKESFFPSSYLIFNSITWTTKDQPERQTVSGWHCQTSWPSPRWARADGHGRQRDEKHVIWIFVPLSPCKYGLTSESGERVASIPRENGDKWRDIRGLRGRCKWGVASEAVSFRPRVLSHMRLRIPTPGPRIRRNLSLVMWRRRAVASIRLIYESTFNIWRRSDRVKGRRAHLWWKEIYLSLWICICNGGASCYTMAGMRVLPKSLLFGDNCTCPYDSWDSVLSLRPWITIIFLS